MRHITLIILTLISLTFVSTTPTNAQKKGKANSKAQWKEARKGQKVAVNWTMTVTLVFNDYAVCYLDGDYHYDVRLYQIDPVELHRDDIVIVKGETFGVSDMGQVQVMATSVTNKGPR
ncbi:MAG: hypothetical protein JSS75_04130 [Bacteroidetes bacterium]|nr:hypothetical protein [Bacteroidota bacterium]